MNAANLNKTVRYMKKHKTILPAYHNLWKLLCLSAYLLATMYLQSCINRPSSYTCDLDALETTPIAYKSSIYKNVKLVFLDSYPPISSIKKMLENEGNLYILDTDNHLHAFTNTGKYLHTIGATDTDFEKYKKISDFTIASEDNCIYAIDTGAQAIHTYDLLTGHFIESKKLDDTHYRSQYIAYAEGFLYTDLLPLHGGKHLLRRLGRTAKEADTYLLQQETNTLTSKYHQTSSPFFHASHGGFYFIPPLCNIIFELKKGKINPFLTVNSKNFNGKTSLPQSGGKDEEQSNLSNRIHYIYNCIVNSHLVSFSYLQENTPATVVKMKDSPNILKTDMLTDDLLFKKENVVYLPLHYATTNFNGDYYYLNPPGVSMLKEYADAGYLLSDSKTDSNNNLAEELRPIILYYTYK